MNIYITDEHNQIYFPLKIHTGGDGAYKLPGYNAQGKNLVFKNFAMCLNGKKRLRIWHGEDLLDFSESNNGGKHCVSVYGLTVTE